VFYLPSYSPELNPDEVLNANLKHAVTRKPPARNLQQLKRAVISHMRPAGETAGSHPQLLPSSARPLCCIIQVHSSRINNAMTG
jgi:hypothetical protein